MVKIICTFLLCIWIIVNIAAFICTITDAVIFHIPVDNPIDDIPIIWRHGLDGRILAFEAVLLFPALYLAYIVLKILR